MSPFEFGFLDRSKGGLAITDNIVNAFFAIDIVLTFFVAYLEKTSYLLIDDPRLIAKRYAKTWLILDFISTIPSETVRFVLPKAIETYGYLNMLRLWRVRRVSAMFARYSYGSFTSKLYAANLVRLLYKLKLNSYTVGLFSNTCS